MKIGGGAALQDLAEPLTGSKIETRVKKRKLGSLDFQVFPISFGGAGISSEGRGYSFGYISEKDAIALLRKAYDRGISLFDTAPIYGHGVSETRMGKAFKDVREKVFIVTKSGVTRRHRRWLPLWPSKAS